MCVCDPLNRTGANFVMVALVSKTFVTRLLLLVHFHLCVCYAFLSSSSLFCFFFFCMLCCPLIIHSIMTEA